MGKRVTGPALVERGGEPACQAYVRTCSAEGLSAEAEILPVGDGQASDGPGGAVWLVVHGLVSPLGRLHADIGPVSPCRAIRSGSPDETG